MPSLDKEFIETKGQLVNCKEIQLARIDKLTVEGYMEMIICKIWKHKD